MMDEKVLSYVERIERLIEEIAGIRQDIRDIYLEAKSQGHPPEILREVVKRRAMEPGIRRERDALLVVYESALGSSDHSADDQREALLLLAEAKAAQVTEIRLAELSGLVKLLDPDAEKVLVATIALVLDLRARRREISAEITGTLKVAKAQGYDAPRISEVCRRVELIDKHGREAVLAAEATRHAYIDVFERHEAFGAVQAATKDPALQRMLGEPAPKAKKSTKVIGRLAAQAAAARRALEG